MALSVTETCIQTAQDEASSIKIIVEQQMTNSEEQVLIADVAENISVGPAENLLGNQNMALWNPNFLEINIRG